MLIRDVITQDSSMFTTYPRDIPLIQAAFVHTPGAQYSANPASSTGLRIQTFRSKINGQWENLSSSSLLSYIQDIGLGALPGIPPTAYRYRQSIVHHLRARFRVRGAGAGRPHAGVRGTDGRGACKAEANNIIGAL